ncbi:MAG: hypothetical protein M3Y72_08425 [Acidobacteriota bacterium]|nr:hypothetical protein [Acidobacteriota bacterium]
MAVAAPKVRLVSDKSLDRTAFPQSVLEHIGSYVYRLVDPRNGQTFYVGKGTGNRLFEHVAEAASLPDRASLKMDRIREIEASGDRVRYVIHRHGLSDDVALIVESTLIDAYQDLSNAQVGHGAHSRGSMTVGELIGMYDRGVAEIDVPVVLLNLNRQFDRSLTDEQLYERTRGYWVMNPDKHPEVKYAMAIAYGLIREVYRIEHWERSPVYDIVESDLRRVDASEGRSAIRCAFVGSVATDVRERFIYKSLPGNSQNPVRWMNC